MSRWSRLLLSRLAAWGLFRPVWSEGIIAETWRVLTWKSLSEGLSYADVQVQANRMLNYLVDVMEFVSLRMEGERPAPWPELRDRQDDHIWWTAVRARDTLGASFVISHNLKDFPPAVVGPHAMAEKTHECRRHVFGGIEYLTVVEFLSIATHPRMALSDVLDPPPLDEWVIRSSRDCPFAGAQ